MSASRRVVESVNRPYAAAALDAAVERQARRGAGASLASPDRPTSFAEPYREAHLESFRPRTAPSTVRAAALERLGAHLAADENFGRKLSKDAARALNGVNYLTEREKRILAGLDKRAWGALVEASDKFKVAVGKKSLAGLPSGSQFGDVEFGGRGGAPADWGGGRTTPGGPGITLGSGFKVPGRAGGGASSGATLGGGDDDGGRGGGSGHFGSYGGYTGHGNAGDPKSPTGGPIGGPPGGGGRGGSPFQGTADRYTGIGKHGDAYGGGGISGGSLPSRAVLAGSAWKALHPGRDISDDPKNPDAGTPNIGAGGPLDTPAEPHGADPGAPGSPPGGPNVPAPKSPPMTPDSGAGHRVPAGHSIAWDIGVGAVVGTGTGVVASLGWWSLGVGVIGAGVGALVHKLHHMPADTDLTGGSGGGGGPGGPRARALQQGVYYMPADDTTGTSPTGPRSQILRSLRSAAFYRPSDDATGAPPGPRSRSAPEGSLYMPAPDDPRPGNPHSRQLAAAGIVPY